MPLKQYIERAPLQQTVPDKPIHPSAGTVECSFGDVAESIPERFEKIVSMFPNRLAVKVGERSVTYAELNRAANRIAHAILDKRGEGSEPIALFFEHGIDVIAAIFGVLKAGKFYIVLNHTFPHERNSYIADDSDTPFIITNRENLEAANQLASHHRALLSLEDVDQYPVYGPSIPVRSESLAALLYTSGSTGQPKGVISTHLNVIRSLRRHTQDLAISPNDRFTLLHSLSFGSALYHFFPSLLNGASLFPFDIKSEGINGVVNGLQDEHLTIYHSAPAVFRQLSAALTARQKLGHLRFVRVSGAPITALDFDLYKKHFASHTRLIVGMGSTEARGISSAVIDQTFCFPKNGAPVGYAEPGKKIFLLNESGVEVSPGEVGEIAVKGRNLSPGYWKQPKSMTEKYLPDPKGGGRANLLDGRLGSIPSRWIPDSYGSQRLDGQGSRFPRLLE